MIIFNRVDARGLHGQVVLRWMSAYPCDGCIIVDNEIANSDQLKLVYKGAAPEHVKVFMFSEEKALSKLSEAISSDKRYFLLVRNPIVLENLSKQGLDLSFMKELTLGPTLNLPGSFNAIAGWNYTKEEFKAIDYISNKGVEIRFHMTPEQQKYYWKDVRKNLLEHLT